MRMRSCGALFEVHMMIYNDNVASEMIEVNFLKCSSILFSHGNTKITRYHNAPQKENSKMCVNLCVVKLMALC
jgi:hypothetical protein